MVAFSGHRPLVMSSAPPSEGNIQGSAVGPIHYKPFNSHEHYVKVMDAIRKLTESGFYWGAISARQASSLLYTEDPGAFLIRDSSNPHYLFTLSLQTVKGPRNIRIHSKDGIFFLQPNPQNTIETPQFDCVLKLIAHYMEKGPDTGKTEEASLKAENDPKFLNFLTTPTGESIPMKLRKPIKNALSSLQHLCRRTLNNGGSGVTEELPHTLKDYLEEYDAPI